MKRYGNLYSQIISFENLFLASQKAQKGKRFRDNILEFNFDLECNLFDLQRDLQAQTYQPEGYYTFVIRDPKERLISATAYRDRIVHHALCNIIIPLIEPSFIPDSYANRIGFGTHKALKRFTTFARSSRYVLQCDIAKYFPSIDRHILKSIIRRKIKCQDTLWLIDLILDNSNNFKLESSYELHGKTFSPMTATTGLPIGNLTSQFFANLYLNDFDHFLKDNLKVRKYLRYVDDFALFSDDRDFLAKARHELEKYLATLRLKIHPIKSQLFETRHGASFLGFRIFPNHIRIRSQNLQKGRKRLKEIYRKLGTGKISPEQIAQSLQSWFAHLAHADTYYLRQQIAIA